VREIAFSATDFLLAEPPAPVSYLFCETVTDFFAFSDSTSFSLARGTVILLIDTELFEGHTSLFRPPLERFSF